MAKPYSLEWERAMGPIVVGLLCFGLGLIIITVAAFRFEQGLDLTHLQESADERVKCLKAANRWGVLSFLTLIFLHQWITESAVLIRIHPLVPLALFTPTVVLLVYWIYLTARIRGIRDENRWQSVRFYFGLGFGLALNVLLMSTSAWLLRTGLHHSLESLTTYLTSIRIQQNQKLWLEGILALGTTLALQVYFAPLLIRILFPLKAIDDPILEASLRRAFDRAGIEAPRFLKLDLDQIKMFNAMVTGTRFGIGPFKSALVISNGLKKHLTPEEFEAVIFHEISHFKLSHIPWRMAALLILGKLAIMLWFCLSLLSDIYLSDPSAHAVANFLSLGLSIIFLIFIFNKVLHFQELQADAYAVRVLGANPEAMISALTQITRLNDQADHQGSSTHPTLNQRVASIRKRGLRAKQAHPLFVISDFFADFWPGRKKLLIQSCVFAISGTLSIAASYWIPAYRLRCAVTDQDWPSIKKLASSRQTVNSPDVTRSGETALLAAIQTGNPKLIEFLLESGADPNIRGAHWGQHFPVQLALSTGNILALKLLHAYGGRLEHPHYSMNSLVKLAVNQGGIEGLKFLESKGASLTTRDDKGQTPLILAARHGHKHIVEYLFNKGVSALQTDLEGHSVLDVAIHRKDLELVKLLTQYGADPNQKCVHGDTPLKKARKWRQTEIEKVLLAAQPGVSRNVASQ